MFLFSLWRILLLIKKLSSQQGIWLLWRSVMSSGLLTLAGVEGVAEQEIMSKKQKNNSDRMVLSSLYQLHRPPEKSTKQAAGVSRVDTPDSWRINPKSFLKMKKKTNKNPSVSAQRYSTVPLSACQANLASTCWHYWDVWHHHSAQRKIKKKKKKNSHKTLRSVEYHHPRKLQKHKKPNTN